MAKTKIFLSKSPQQTIAFAKKMARELLPGSVIALSGDLGSGKTTFIKGIALGLGLKNSDDVKSPTFVVMHVYPTKIPLYHFDLYRLESLKELEAIGFEEFVNDPRAISCVEWSEKAKALLPIPTCYVILKITSDHGRQIRLLKS